MVVFIGLIGIRHDICALSAIRAPYLQLGNSNSIVIRWRTDQPVVSRVQFGQAADALTNEVLAQAAVTTYGLVSIISCSLKTSDGGLPCP